LSTERKFSNCKVKPLILFSCLDWGLGHTTRSVPLIREFLESGCNLIVACNSIQKTILEKEFPEITYVNLPGYDVSYSAGSIRTCLKIIIQGYKILTKIKQENAWLKAFLKENKPTAVISDNRYGLYHPDIPCIFITHQLYVRSGFGAFMDRLVQQSLYRFINRFTACWVPDYQLNNGLAGILSHPEISPLIPVTYLGAISRFHKCDTISSKTYDVLVIISGPEPQRSIFEKKVLEQCASTNKKIAIVRGLPGDTNILNNNNSTIFNHLDATELNKLICESELIICRSGYTSIMDMVKLKKKMVVVPTPGQPEQEYLADYLSKNHLASSITQKNFTISQAFYLAAQFPYRYIDADMNEYKLVIQDFLQNISSLSPSLMH
jgi:uncharacterized protein (TIGR00661 family)